MCYDKEYEMSTLVGGIMRDNFSKTYPLSQQSFIIRVTILCSAQIGTLLRMEEDTSNCYVGCRFKPKYVFTLYLSQGKEYGFFPKSNWKTLKRFSRVICIVWFTFLKVLSNFQLENLCSNGQK